MTMTGTQNLATRIEEKLKPDVIDGIGLSTSRGLAVESMSQAMEVAKLMSLSDCAVPKHMRGNPGACLAIAIQGWEWAVNPFAIANKSYVVNDRLCYEAGLYQAVLVRRAPIKGRLKMEYKGEGPTRICRVFATTTDGDLVEYQSPQFGNIKPKNSPLWVNDPDQQLYYFSVRAFARRHFQDVMMGIYTVDEMQDTVTEAPATQSLQSRIESHRAESTINGEIVEQDEKAPQKSRKPKQSTAPAAPDATQQGNPTPGPIESAGDHGKVSTVNSGSKTNDVGLGAIKNAGDHRDSGATNPGGNPNDGESRDIGTTAGGAPDPDAFPINCTINQLHELAMRKMPPDLPSPEEGIKRLDAYLKVKLPKPFVRMSSAEKKKVWDFVGSDEFNWKE